MKIICLVCNSNKINFNTKYISKDNNFINLNIYNCENCKLSFVNPLPTDEQLREYYETQLETSIGPEGAGILNTSFANMLAKTRLNYITEYIDNKINSNLQILEIGPGYGHLAEKFITKYNITNYSVVEYDSNCFSKLKKIGAKVYKDLNEINFDNKFNLVILSHVLEHIGNPLAYLSNIKNNYLNKNSYIFIDVPCEDWKYKQNVDPHLVFFNKSSLSHLNKLLNMKIIKLDYIGEELKKINETDDKFINIFRKINLLMLMFIFYFLKKDKNYNLIEYVQKIKFKADKSIEKKSRWIRLIIKN